jgi:hypothetical protein
MLNLTVCRASLHHAPRCWSRATPVALQLIPRELTNCCTGGLDLEAGIRDQLAHHDTAPVGTRTHEVFEESLWRLA